MIATSSERSADAPRTFADADKVHALVAAQTD
jgi:hypothetical protein